MADLGTIGITVEEMLTYSARRIPAWKGYPNVPSTFLPATGSITGAVTETYTPIERCVVRLYYRPTGALIESRYTEADGTFVFPALESDDTDNYFVVAFDPDGGTQYNALIFDRLTAVG